MMPYSPSELILNPDGSVYHLGLKAEDIPDLVFTVGDPDRVGSVTTHFDSILWEKNRREFKMVRGHVFGKDVLVMSTGMGTDNIDIVLNELDAAVNIDPVTRINRQQHRKLTIIRIGTSGAIDPDIPLGSLLVSEGALAFDGLLPYYEHSFSRIEITASPVNPFYIAAPHSQKAHWEDLYHGITATLPGFYAPQGRSIKLKSTFSKALDELTSTYVGEHHVTNFEMETSGIYALAHLLGHDAYSFSALLANRANGTFHDKPEEAINELIKKVLAWASTL